MNFQAYTFCNLLVADSCVVCFRVARVDASSPRALQVQALLCRTGLRTFLVMASRLAKQVAAVQQKDRLFGGAARSFYFEICRCLPFIQRLHKMEEMVSLRELRAIVKDRFKEYKNVKDGRVVDLLIFKGREEIETYLLMHKQRHHVLTEVVEPYYNKQRAVKKVSTNSTFLDSFLTSAYPQLQQRL